LALGTNHILFQMENQANTFIPKDFEREIMTLSVSDFNDRWHQYYLSPDAVATFDYNIIMKLRRVDVGRETLREREYVDSKRIKDGYDYVLDGNGNVQKDTLGNDIKVDRYVDIYATVFETLQHKEARVGGTLEIFDTATKDLIRTETVDVVTDFENYASTFRGDRRALSRDSRRHLGNSPVPFPSDADMILLAVDNLKPAIMSKLKGCTIYVWDADDM